MDNLLATVRAELGAALPGEIVDALLSAFEQQQTAFSLRRWEASELNGGKFCEAVMAAIYYLDTGEVDLGEKARLGVEDKIRYIENKTRHPLAIRLHVPRAVRSIHGFRSQRGVAHTAFEIDPNEMDATHVMAVSRWILSELLRQLWRNDSGAVESVISALSRKSVPLIEPIGEDRAFNVRGLSARDKALLLLYREHPEAVGVHTLARWVGTEWRRLNPVVQRMEREALVFRRGGAVHLIANGVLFVEEHYGASMRSLDGTGESGGEGGAWDSRRQGPLAQLVRVHL